MAINKRLASLMGGEVGFTSQPGAGSTFWFTARLLRGVVGVADAAVIGVPDERLGEVGRAFIVRRPGSELDEPAVIEYTRKHLANFKTPRSVVFVAELPRNPGGKVVKPTLREMV